MQHAPHVSVLLSSFLAGTLRAAGPLLAPWRASAFLRQSGGEREVFLPFYYKWFDGRAPAQDQALHRLQQSVEQGRISAPRVFHAPFLRPGSMLLRFRRNLGDPALVRTHVSLLRRECELLGRVREAFNIREKILYVIHLGLRIGVSPSEAMRSFVAALKPVLPVAAEAGVILAVENVADRMRDHFHLGARLSEVVDTFDQLRDHPGAAQALGWTFDISHALLGHGGDVDDIRRHTQSLLPFLVHIHVNSPRLHLPERQWSDRHEAPHEHTAAVWELLRLACAAPRFREFRTITYEVSWGLPLVRSLCGGSRLNEVVHGYDLVRSVALDALKGLDAKASAPYTAPTALGSAWLGQVPKPLAPT